MDIYGACTSMYIHSVSRSGYMYRHSYSRTATSKEDQRTSQRVAMKSNWFDLALQPRPQLGLEVMGVIESTSMN